MTLSKKGRMGMVVIVVLVLLIVTIVYNTAKAGGGNPVSTAIGTSTTSGQVSCGATATLLKASTTTGRVSIIFQNHGSNAVYIAPRSDISVTNAGILLDTTRGLSVTIDRTSGDVAWYCITSSSTSTVGWTEEK